MRLRCTPAESARWKAAAAAAGLTLSELARQALEERSRRRPEKRDARSAVDEFLERYGPRPANL